MKINRNQIKSIAAMLTDDPDIFCEDMAGNISQSPTPTTGDLAKQEPTTVDKPLNSAEINREANEITGDNPQATNAVTDQIKAQQEMQKTQEQERQKLLAPQMAQLDKLMTGLQQNVLKGQQNMTSNQNALGALDKDMEGLNAVIGNLKKQF